MDERAERIQTFSISRIRADNTFDIVLDIGLNVSCVKCDVTAYEWV
jgi:hypothetical protein